MTEIKDGGQAFPKTGNFNQDACGAYDSVDQDGMTLRDYFAAKAIQVSYETEMKFPTGSRGEPNYAGIAARAYFLADAMLKEREQP